MYKVEDVFCDDPDNPNNVLMTIPPHICEDLGWNPGDLVKIKIEENVLSIEKIHVKE